MDRRTILFWLSIPFSFILISCGTSTGSRYPQEQVLQKAGITDSNSFTENFDLTKYHAKIDLKEKAKQEDSSSSNVWYSYHLGPIVTDTSQTIIKTLPGYRVLVLSTDNIDEANSMRSDVYFKTDHSAVYVIFDPPFYKVEAGDFTNRNDAQSLNFKLKQMGFKDVRVINETINKYR
ncbi:MAG: SPOR domain-containing protein [Ignavibacteriaceae bacterium]|nr:SPOR domain-containing protein [Ignavibacteriaceae bacterium]